MVFPYTYNFPPWKPTFPCVYTLVWLVCDWVGWTPFRIKTTGIAPSPYRRYSSERHSFVRRTYLQESPSWGIGRNQSNRSSCQLDLLISLFNRVYIYYRYQQCLCFVPKAPLGYLRGILIPWPVIMQTRMWNLCAEVYLPLHITSVLRIDFGVIPLFAVSTLFSLKPVA